MYDFFYGYAFALTFIFDVHQILKKSHKKTLVFQKFDHIFGHEITPE